MSTVVTNSSAAADTIERQLEDAREAEARVEAQLGEAVLASINGGAAVPGKLHQAVQDARIRRIGLEAAVQAAQRAQDAEAKKRTSTAREQRRASVEAELDALQAAAVEVEEALRQFAATGAGARALDALERVRRFTNDMSAQTLTPGGWLLNEVLSNLRNARTMPFTRLTADAMVMAMQGQPIEEISAYVAKLRGGVLTAFDTQPEGWLAD